MKTASLQFLILKSWSLLESRRAWGLQLIIAGGTTLSVMPWPTRSFMGTWKICILSMIPLTAFTQEETTCGRPETGEDGSFTSISKGRFWSMESVLTTRLPGWIWQIGVHSSPCCMRKDMKRGWVSNRIPQHGTVNWAIRVWTIRLRTSENWCFCKLQKVWPVSYLRRYLRGYLRR